MSYSDATSETITASGEKIYQSKKAAQASDSNEDRTTDVENQEQPHKEISVN